MAQKKKKRGLIERSARNVARDTAGDEPGFGTTLSRGVAMIGSMMAEAISPTEGASDTAIKHGRDAGVEKRKPAKAKAKAGASKKAAKRRAPVEKATGTSVLKRRLEGVNELVKAGKK